MEVIYNMKQISQCIECGESITNPICPECIVGQAIACIADKQIAGNIKEWETKKSRRILGCRKFNRILLLRRIAKSNFLCSEMQSISDIKKLNEKLAAIIKANYTDAGIDCISCKNAFAVCPHCTARYLRDILPRNLSYLFSSVFNY